MTDPDTRFARRARGMTLVELLIAMAIAVVLVIIAATLYRTTAQALSGQQARARGPHAANQALAALRDDLAGTILPAEDAACPFVVEPLPESGSELAFCTLRAGPVEGSVVWAVPRRMTYRLAAAGGSTSALVRVSVPLTGPGSQDPPETNVLVKEASRFVVSVFDGTDWRRTWPPGEPGASPRPRLVRAELQVPDGPEGGYTTEMFVPAGNSITSTLLRTSTPAAD